MNSTGKEEAMPMKSIVQIASALLLALAVVPLTGCVTMTSSSGSKQSDAISLAGAYVLDPDQAATDAGLDLSGIPSSRRAVMVVYDVKPDGSKNWEGWPKCSLIYPSGNEYASTLSDLPTQLQVFLSRDGYGGPGSELTLDAGTETVRSCAVFLVSQTDIDGSEPGSLNIDLGDFGQSTMELPPGDLKSISLPDEILQLEPDYAGYQLARSLEARASFCQIALNRGANASANNNTTEASFYMATAYTMFSNEANWGVSLVSSGNSSDTTCVVGDVLPAMDYGQLSSYDPILGADAEKAGQLLRTMADNLDAGNYSQLNISKNELQATLSDMLEQCKQFIK